jgi:hypothetical protein
MAGGVGRPQAQPRPCLAGLCWLGWRRYARSARRGQTVLRCPRRRSRRTVSRSPPDCLGSLARQRTDSLAMPVPDCLVAPAIALDFLVSAAGLSCVGRRTVLCRPPDCLDSLTGHPQDCLTMPSPDCLAAAAARLDSDSGDRALGRRRR